MNRRSSTTSVIVVIIAAALLAVYRLVLAPGPSAPVPPPTIAPTAGPEATSILPTIPAQTSVPPTAGPTGGLPSWLKVYFTAPTAADANTDANATDKSVIRYVLPVINAAQKSIDVTSFDLNLPTFTNALVSAKKRGVQVRVVVDGVEGNQTLKASDAPGNQAFDATKTLTGAGITVVNGGRSNGLMHNKIIIVDGSTLLMGSWNMSYNDTFRNDNNVLQITSQKLIANYQAKFNELFVDKRFGTKAKVGAQNPQLNLDGVQVENYFSPPDNVMDKLVGYVNGAKKSIRFIAFTYTHPDLSAAMVARAKAGVKVEGVIENRGASRGALVPLFCAKLPVKTDGNKYTMHHKVIIIDDETVITGSFNFTATADNANDDNVLVIHSPAVAALYNQEFARVYGMGETPQPADVTCK